MIKHTSYFSHDSNSRNDEKILAVRMRHGAEGYGVYFMILERLREEEEYTTTRNYNTLAFDFRVSSALIKSVVEDFDLFVITTDGKRFYSSSFLERMEMKDQSSKKRSVAGKKGMEARWSSQELDFEDNNVITEDNNVITLLQKNITRKEKQSKLNQNKENENEDSLIACTHSKFIKINKVEDFLNRQQSWQEVICVQNHLTQELLKEHVSQFVNLLNERGETEKTAKDAKSHFANWLKIKLKEKDATNFKNDNNSSADQLQRDLADFATAHVGR